MADPMLAAIGAVTVSILVIISATAIVILGVQAGIAVARLIGRRLKP